MPLLRDNSPPLPTQPPPGFAPPPISSIFTGALKPSPRSWTSEMIPGWRLPRWKHSGGVGFEPLRDPEVFAQVRVNSETGTIEWPNGADLAPEFLYEQGTEAEHVA